MSKSRDEVAFEFAVIMREAFVEVALAAYKAGRLGMSEAEMLASVVPSCEPLVESITRRVSVR